MKCRDLLSFQYASQFSLLSGEGGLGNEISWVHCLDSLQTVDWLRGGELIVTTTAWTAEEFCQLAERLLDKKAAGFVLVAAGGADALPPRLLSLCKDLEFPLFLLASGTQVLEIGQAICTAIVQQQKKAGEKEQLLLEVLHGVRLSDKRLQKLRDAGITEGKTWRMVCLQLHPVERNHLDGPAEGSGLYPGKLSEDYILRVKSFIQRRVERYEPLGILFSEEETIFWLMEVSQEDDTASYLGNILYHIKVSFPGVRIHAGVSERFSEIRQVRSAVTHAQEALTLSGQTTDVVALDFYDDMVAYQLIRSVASTKTLEEMTARILGELLQPGSADLLHTLMVYLSCDGNAKLTAEKMFLHSNTLHYRLRKIEGLLRRDLKKNEDLFDVMLAVKIHTYLQRI